MEEVKKSESTPYTPLPLSYEVGQPRIVTSSSFVQELKKKEMVMPQRLKTFDCMTEDDAVFNSIDVTNLLVAIGLYQGEFVPTRGSQESQVAAEFLNYCLHNFSYSTWLDAIFDICSDLQYGFSLLNIVTEKKRFGPYAGDWTLRKLAPRDQKSLAGWAYNKENTEVKGFIQLPPMKRRAEIGNKTYLGNISEVITGTYYERYYPYLRAPHYLHFTYNSKNNNPQGSPPLYHCYKAYLEKQLIEKYEVVGVSKDLGGAMVIKVPSTLVELARDAKKNPEAAKEYQAFQMDASKLHAGEASHIVIFSDVDPASNKPLYDIEFKGIDGGGKQYQTSEIINQKRKSIYNVFGTGFLLLGQESHGSYSLSTNATSTHAWYVERNIMQKVNVLNTQLAPRLLAANNVYVSHKNMPKFVAADPQQLDLDVVSKFIQRAMSVGGMTPGVLEALLSKAGLPTHDLDKVDFTAATSKAGQSKGSSGTGNTQAGGASSSTNSENASKSLVVLEEDGESILAIDPQTKEKIHIQLDR